MLQIGSKAMTRTQAFVDICRAWLDGGDLADAEQFDEAMAAAGAFAATYHCCQRCDRCLVSRLARAFFRGFVAAKCHAGIATNPYLTGGSEDEAFDFGYQAGRENGSSAGSQTGAHAHR